MANPIFHSQFTAQQIEGLIAHGAPKIENGYWYVWDVTTSAWVNTGVTADSETAAADAQAAQEAAEAAQEAAETAQGKAEDAQDAAEAAVAEIETYAKKDGYYEDMSVGAAEQLITDKGYTDTAPYTYRRAGAGHAGTRSRVKSITGATIAWNQLVQNGDFSNGTTGWGAYNGTIAVSDGVLTITSTTGGDVVKTLVQTRTGPVGHKTLIVFEAKASVATPITIRYPFTMPSVVTLAANTWTRVSAIGIAGENNIGMQFISLANGDTGSVRLFMCIDLTAAFGSTIADYLATLTADAAIAKLTAWGFDLSTYHAYTAGKLESVCVSAHKTVGFNLWDEEWVNGIYTNGVLNPAYSTYVSSKNMLPILPNTDYFFHIGSVANSARNFVYYDADGHYIGDSATLYGDGIIRTPSNAAFANFTLGGAYGATYKNDICINLSDPARNGTYEPYNGHTYPIEDIELRGIPSLVDGELVYDGDSYAPSGAVTRRYGVVDLGTLTWARISTVSPFCFGANLPAYKGTMGARNMACGKYEVKVTALTTAYDKVIEIYPDGRAALYVFDTDYTDVAGDAFKAAMSGVYLVYELATPTAESATPYAEIEVTDKDGTEEYVDAAVATGTRDVAVPVGGERLYMRDLVGVVEDIPEAPSADGSYRLAVTVSGGVATYSWVSA